MLFSKKSCVQFRHFCLWLLLWQPKFSTTCRTDQCSTELYQLSAQHSSASRGAELFQKAALDWFSWSLLSCSLSICAPQRWMLLKYSSVQTDAEFALLGYRTRWRNNDTTARVRLLSYFTLLWLSHRVGCKPSGLTPYPPDGLTGTSVNQTPKL